MVWRYKISNFKIDQIMAR